MICENVSFDSDWITKIYALRQAELREPLGMNLFDEDLLAEQNEYFFIAHQSERLLSCMQLRDVGNGTLKLRQMATSDIYKGMGLGKKLVEFGEGWARESGFKKIGMHARKRALGFYEKLGYTKVGEEFLEVNIPHYKMEKLL